MQFRTQFWLLGVRSCALGGVATAIGVFGHVHAGGGDPSVAQVIAVWLAASLLSAPFLMREAGWFRLAALLLAEQVLIHAGVMVMVGMRSMPAMPGMAMPAIRDMSAMPSGGMLAGHAIAAVIAGLWLARGEWALWTLIALAGASIAVLWQRFVLASVDVPDVQIPTDLQPLWGLRLARDVCRRGPPLVAMQ